MGHLGWAVSRLRKTNIKMFAVGIGKGISASQLKSIASSPANVLYVKDYSKLKDYIAKISNSLCPSKWFFI